MSQAVGFGQAFLELLCQLRFVFRDASYVVARNGVFPQVACPTSPTAAGH